jgi:hypothetical protein
MRGPAYEGRKRRIGGVELPGPCGTAQAQRALDDGRQDALRPHLSHRPRGGDKLVPDRPAVDPCQTFPDPADRDGHASLPSMGRNVDARGLAGYARQAASGMRSRSLSRVIG